MLSFDCRSVQPTLCKNLLQKSDRMRAFLYLQVDTEQLLKNGFRSISMECLDEVLEMLFGMMRASGVQEPSRGYNSEEVKTYLAKNGLFLPLLCEPKFSFDTPDYVITYMWLATTLRELVQILKELFGSRNGRVWIDVIFNDQRSTQV
jgi:hypothetical protein